MPQLLTPIIDNLIKGQFAKCSIGYEKGFEVVGILFERHIRGQTHAMANDQLILAPAAGSGIGKKLADRLLARPDFEELLENAAVAALTADMPQRWDPNGKCWAPAQPDAKTRLAALLGLMAQFEGDPVKRIIHQHTTAQGFDLAGALESSPELREAVATELRKAEWKHSGQAAHKRPKKVTEAKAKPADTEL